MSSVVPVPDTYGRPLRNLRLSVTDRCNLRCSYCMPEETYTWLDREDVLDYEELVRLASAFVGVGVSKIRLTGGEPLLRRGMDQLVRLLAEIDGLREIALTTNGIKLGDQAQALRAAGLSRLTISLDTLDADTYRVLTRRDELARAKEGIDAACEAGFEGTKLNTVVMRGVNDQELPSILGYAAERGIEARFIEYMDVGGATDWSHDMVVPRPEILARLERAFGPIRTIQKEPSAPADRFQLTDGRVFGVIASTTAPFCGSCDRSRVTADGRWFTCLYARDGYDLRKPLRSGMSLEELQGLIGGMWGSRTDRGAEERLLEVARGRLADAGELRTNPHLEMHTRGG